MSEPALVLSCEHGGNAVPVRWARLFRSARGRALLRSHRGWDPGALELARLLARELRAPLIACTVSRLLADANRPVDHPKLFSEFTRELSEPERRAILSSSHQPHWEAVRRAVQRGIAGRGRVLHVSVHSFTPMLGGVARGCDAGLLYDPARRRERELCERWQARLAGGAPGLRVRRNFPYRGVSAALTTTLRGIFPRSDYLGIELEMNQGLWARRSPSARGRLAREIAATFAGSMDPDLDSRGRLACGGESR
jgi:predicted N-formylglutamate amidohydrolase